CGCQRRCWSLNKLLISITASRLNLYARFTGEIAIGCELARTTEPNRPVCIWQRGNRHMARIKMAYVGGGSTRAPGTVASIVEQGENFQGSELVLIDLNMERLEIVKTIGEKMARNRGIDLKISITTDRRAGLQDCDAVLTSYRPGGFEARYLDESIPLKHG